MVKFGVQDYDAYWVNRKARGKTSETPVHRKIAELVRAHVAPGEKVLDCGVGPAQAYRLLAPDYRMHGIEVSSEALALYDFDTTKVKQADLNHGIPDFGCEFHCIIVSMILHHLEDPETVLKQARDRLADRGILLVVHPNIGYYKHRLHYLLRGELPPLSSSHRVFLSAQEMRGLLTRAGFEIIQTTSSKPKLRAQWWPQFFSQDLFYVCRSSERTSGQSTSSA